MSRLPIWISVISWNLCRVLQELARRKKVAVILSIHELDLAERVSDWVLCVSPGQESQFGRPEEMLTPEHLSELFQVEEGRFRQTGGSMELPRPEGAPEVFVLAGGGSGRAVFCSFRELEPRLRQGSYRKPT